MNPTDKALARLAALAWGQGESTRIVQVPELAAWVLAGWRVLGYAVTGVLIAGRV